MNDVNTLTSKKISGNLKLLLGLPLMASVLLLSGCSGMFVNEARCPFADKGGCQSVSDVNDMVSQGKFTSNKHFVRQKHDQTQSVSNDLPATSNATSGLDTLTPTDGEPLRTKEVDARMWVAPWEDKAGAFHGASFVTFVVKPSVWNSLAAKNVAKTYGDENKGDQ